MTPATLSIVAPVYNEARILAELVERCARAAAARPLPFEIVLVDDASGDDTAERLAELTAREPRLHPCRLSANAGQFRATQEGLRRATGDWIVALDGDLQDPPELIPSLIDALAAAPPETLAIMAVKRERHEQALFMLGQFVFHRLQHALSRVSSPLGAGSYCIMRRAVAQRIAVLRLERANLSTLVAVVAHSLGGRLDTVPYEKAARYDDTSRVGWRGLLAEALESLAVTGALPRLCGGVAVACALAAFAVADAGATRHVLLAAAALLATASAVVGLRVRQALQPLQASDGRA